MGDLGLARPFFHDRLTTPFNHLASARRRVLRSRRRMRETTWQHDERPRTSENANARSRRRPAAKRERRQDKSPDEEDRGRRVRRELRHDRGAHRAHRRDARAVRRRSDHLRSIRRGEVGADGPPHRTPVGIVSLRSISRRAACPGQEQRESIARGSRSALGARRRHNCGSFLGRGPDDKLNFRSSLAFFAVHLVPFLAIFTGVTRTALILAVVTFTTRMFCITAGYHRYFSHKSYRLNRVSGSSCSRSAGRWRRRRVRCGGPRITATITASPTPNATCTHPSAGSGGATSAGSSATSTTRPT